MRERRKKEGKRKRKKGLGNFRKKGIKRKREGMGTGLTMRRGRRDRER